MAVGIIIGGVTGTGKSASIETLDTKKTVLIKAINKALPFRGKGFTPLTKDGGNLVVTDRAPVIVNTLQYVSKNRPEIEVIVIDDLQYVSAFEFMRRSKETGFTKFTDIGKNLFDIASLIPDLREDLIVVITNHLDIEYDGMGGSSAKIKTIGKLVDSYLVFEGMFTIVLYTDVDPENRDIPYGFITQNNGSNTVKSPKGMFEDLRIPNDLNYVVQKVKEYYQ